MEPRVPQPEAPFLEWLDGWYDSLGDLSLGEVVRTAGGPDRIAVLVVDLLEGFCSRGPLASPRVAALLPGTARFLDTAWEAGIRRFLLAQDAHPPDSPEFAAFPPHCIAGTPEAETAAALRDLRAVREALVVPKRSLNVGLEPAFEEWLGRNPEVTDWIVIGDCTDLCIYSAAMHLRLQANARGLPRRVIVPADLTDTYDLPVGAAKEIGALPHPGDLLHRLFLYHLALNGIRVVGSLQGSDAG